MALRTRAGRRSNPIATATTVSRSRRTTRSSTRLPSVVAEALLLGFGGIGGCVIDDVGTLDIQGDVEQSRARTSEVSAPLLVASRRSPTTGGAKR